MLIPSTNELFVTSHRLLDNNSGQRLEITKVKISADIRSIACEDLATNGIRMPNDITMLIADFYGCLFNSVNSVVVHTDVI